MNTLTRDSKTTFGVIEEFKFDAALLRAVRRLEELAARELGQWGKGHEPRSMGLQNEQLDDAIAEAARKLTPAQVEAAIARILAEDKDASESADGTGGDPSDSGGASKARLARGGLRARTQA